MKVPPLLFNTPRHLDNLIDQVVKFIFKEVFYMIQFMQESALPKLSQTSLYGRYDQSSGITQSLREELSVASEHIQKPDDLKELVALMRLNGDPVVKKAIDAWEKGEIIVLFNMDESKIPPVLPYVVIGKEGAQKCYVFADKLMTRLNSTNEYINLMAGLEAAYLALCLQKNPDKFVNNRNLMFLLVDIYQFMVLCPLEVALYMKGDNLTKAMMYAIAFYYKIIDGDQLSAESINFKRLLKDKVNNDLCKQVVEEVRGLQSANFMELLELVKRINPTRYSNLDATYIQSFVRCCGIYLVFALENPSYLFLLLTSSAYKTKLTSFNLNKLVGNQSKKTITQFVSVV